MFGRLRPQNSQLTSFDRQAYQAGYCGLCQTLRQESGRFSTIFLSYELTFLAHLEAAHQNEARPPQSVGCTAIPWRKVTSLSIPAGIGALGLVLAGLKLEDDRRDEGSLTARVGLLLLEPKMAKALKTLEEASFPVASFARFGTDQAVVETALSETQAFTVLERLRRASVPSGRFSQSVFSWLAESWPIGFEEKARWREFGCLLGEAIYVVDALDDRVRDARRSSFNPLSNLHSQQIGELQEELARRAHTLIQTWSNRPERGDSWPALSSSITGLSKRLSQGVRRISSPDSRLQGLRQRHKKAAYWRHDNDACCEAIGGLTSGLCWFAGTSHREQEMERVHGDLLQKPEVAGAPKELQRIPPFLPGDYACPSCGVKPMDRQSIGSAGLFHCAKCSGVWLNGAHLPELRKRKETKDFVTFPQAGAPPVHPPGTRVCPIDGETLELSREKGVTVEECPTCQGWYLDAGELGSFL